jgi:ABC-type multidrug transport system ATPase subunit
MNADESAATCLSGSPPYIFPPVYDNEHRRACLPGFYCPALDPNNASTYPIACIGTPDCQVLRVFGEECDERQSDFEPILCPAKYYCPNSTIKIKCPSGHFCPHGSIKPHKCPAMAICAEGSDRPREYGPLIILVIVFIALCVVRHLYLTRWRLRGHTPGSSIINVPGAPAHIPFEEDVLEQPALTASTSMVLNTSRSAATLARQFRGVNDGQSSIRIDFSNLRVTLPHRGPNQEELVLLESVSGSLKPGTVTAIMGPSGAGKTVLLTTLLQRIDPAWKVDGRLEVNHGNGDFSKLRSFIGFVPQDDILHNDLTVEANLYYASELRLPRTWNADRRAQMREVVLETLGLLPHRTSVVGTETERGISGGQRKRVSIGVELASAPLMLLLDEPTSGLDSTTSLELVNTLKTVAASANITVVMVIHQPRLEIWDALDELLILGKGGRTVYKGPQASAQAYFQSAGVQFDPHHNPADDIMDAVVSDSKGLIDAWDQSERDPNSEPITPVLIAPSASDSFHGAGPLKQFGLFFLRSVEKQLSDFTSLVVELIVILLCGLVLGNSMGDINLPATYREPYERISPAAFKQLLPQLSMYQLMSLGLAASVAGVNVFGLERLQYFREVPTGVNRIAYFVANVTAAWFRVFLASLVYSAVFTILGSIVVPFAYLYFVALLTYWCIYGIGACISVTAEFTSAALIAATASICVGVFNGFIGFPFWLKCLTFGFWGSQIVQEQHARWIMHWSSDAMATPETGYEAGRLTLSFALMLIIGIIIHIIALLLMVFTHRSKQR